MSDRKRSRFSGRVATVRHRAAWVGLSAALALCEVQAAIDAPEEDAPAPPGSALGAIQQVVSNTVQALEAMGLAVDPVQARERVREAVLTVADPGAMILTQEDARLLQARAEGLFYDTGLRITSTNGFPLVAGVREGSAAAEADIQPGWVVEAVDGRTTADQRSTNLQRMLCDHVPGTVELVFREDRDADTRTVTLEKRPGRLPPVETREVMPLGLRYMKVNTLGEGAGAAIGDTLLDWAGEDAFGVVLDLRGAGGSDTESVARIVGLVARPDETLFGFEDAAGREISTFKTENEDTLGMPLMILVDEETTGAAELLAAAVSGSGRGAMLLGSPTGGDPMIRDKVELPDGDWAYIATRRLVTGGGEIYDGKSGVKPDVIVVLRDRSYRDYEPPPPLLTDRRETTEEEKETLKLRQRTRGDVALTRAVDVLLGLKALDIHGFGFEPRPDR